MGERHDHNREDREGDLRGQKRPWLQTVGFAMIWLLKKLIFGHVHEWEDRHRSKLTDDSGSTGARIYCCCKTCGRWKKFDII